MMHSPLHEAVCYFDPILFGVSRNQDEVMGELYKAIDKLNQDPLIVALLRSQLRAYRLEEGIFRTKATKYDMSRKYPQSRWNFYGSKAPDLQCFVIHILSQRSSATTCKRN
jgi:hypothetical protein